MHLHTQGGAAAGTAPGSSVDWGSSPAGLGVRYTPLAMQQLLLRGLLVGDTAAASLRALGVFADSLAQQVKEATVVMVWDGA